MLVIKIDEIKKAFENIFTILHREAGENIYIDQDFYWTILDSDKIHDLQIQPDTGIGSHVDEVAWLSNNLKDKFLSTVELRWMAALFTGIATKGRSQKAHVEICLNDFEKLSYMALKKMKRAMGNELFFGDIDEYWKVAPNSRYDFKNVDPVIMRGSLYNDIQATVQANTNNTISVADLEKLAGIFTNSATVFERDDYLFL